LLAIQADLKERLVGHLKVAMIGMGKAENLDVAMVALVGERLTILAQQAVEVETEEPQEEEEVEVDIQNPVLLVQAVQEQGVK